MVGVASGAVAAILLVGCTSARSNLGTSDSSCYVALPTATRAVGAHGRLIGVHLSTVATLHRQTRRLFDELPHAPAPNQRICVVAFVGSFSKSMVSKPLGRPSGSVAIVVLKFPSNELLGTAIVIRAPVRFGHAHFG
jgi:hypothetical protein